MAHQDVVPVNPSTWDTWTHPPFEGHLDENGWIWGRGTTDMKGTVSSMCLRKRRSLTQKLIALLTVAEKLLKEGFIPERYGFKLQEQRRN
jgi:Gly-Xaa carboxypeptidase